MLMRETVNNALMMIQPTLDSYSFQTSDGQPVLLSANSLSPDRILLLDTFFQVVVWTGDNIANWRKQGYHNDPNYAHLKLLLEAPNDYIKQVQQERFPQPRFVHADQGTSQARFLSAAVDPSITHQTANLNPGGSGEAVATEDVNLEVFMEHLKKLAVQS